MLIPLPGQTQERQQERFHVEVVVPDKQVSHRAHALASPGLLDDSVVFGAELSVGDSAVKTFSLGPAVVVELVQVVHSFVRKIAIALPNVECFQVRSVIEAQSFKASDVEKL